MIVSKSYFVGGIDIANTNNADVEAKVNFYISQYEPEYLLKMFGYELYADYLVNSALTRWTDIINGKTYTVSDVDYKWNGLKTLISGSIYRSPIANYIYYWYTRDQATHTTSVGEITPEVENARRAESMNKQVRAWNKMVEWNLELLHFLDNNLTTYPEWEAVNPYPNELLFPINNLNL